MAVKMCFLCFWQSFGKIKINKMYKGTNYHKNPKKRSQVFLLPIEWKYQDSGGSRIPRRRGRTPSSGRQHTLLPNFPKKLHEIEKILDPPSESENKNMSASAGSRTSTAWKATMLTVTHTQRMTVENHMTFSYTHKVSNDGKFQLCIPIYL